MDTYKKRGYLNSDFKIFHLTDETKREFTYHYHDFDKIIIFIRGDVTYCIEGKSYLLKPYDIVLVNAGDVHRPIINSSSIYERIIIYISSDFISSYKEADYDLGYCFHKARSESSNLLRIASLSKSKLYQVSHELEQSFNDNDYANELYHKILFLEFMIQLNRAALNKKINYIENNYSNSKIIEVIDYLNKHIEEDISIEKLADTFYINKYYLMHTFKDETGYTIGNYLTTKRLILARDLIQNGSPATAACYNCGFKSYSAFSRAYKKCFNATPRELRKEMPD